MTPETVFQLANRFAHREGVVISEQLFEPSFLAVLDLPAVDETLRRGAPRFPRPPRLRFTPSGV